MKIYFITQLCIAYSFNWNLSRNLTKNSIKRSVYFHGL